LLLFLLDNVKNYPNTALIIKKAMSYYSSCRNIS